MDNLIYMLPHRMIDPQLFDPSHEHYKWVSLGGLPLVPPFICSRVHQLDTPWNLAPTLLPIPSVDDYSIEMDFATVMDSIASQFCNLINTTGRTPYVRWSGGVDSTAIVVSLLRVATPQVLEKIIILCNQESIAENPYFYYKFIDKKLTVQNDTNFRVDSSNYNKILLVDGDCAEMIAGSTIAYKLVRSEQTEILDKPWRSFNGLEQIICPDNPSRAEFFIDLVKQSIAYSPLELISVYDFFWWHYFNYKINDSLMRSVAYYTIHLTPAESKEFFEVSLHRFFVYKQMQIWSMVSLPYRKEKNLIDSKYFYKKYIHDFDHNDFYFYNKHKHRSMPDNWFYQFNVESLFAIDQHWNRYSVASVDHRRQFGKIMGRI